MERPLWRILLPILLLVFAVNRGGSVAMALLGEASGLLAAAHSAESAAACAAALGVWLGRPWGAAFVLVLALALGATALLEAFFLGVRPAAAAIAQLIVVALGGGALALLMRRELIEPRRRGDADDPARASHFERG